MRWIDTHVHLFSKNDSDNAGIPLVFGRNELNTPDVYLDILGENKPEAIVVVHFSKAPTAQHVVSSLDELKQKGIKAAGVIKADLADERTFLWLKRPDIKAIRLYAKDSMPDVSGDKWAAVFKELVQSKKHVLIFGDGANLTGLIRQIPEEVTILVDHLGVPKNGADDADFQDVLAIAQQRGNIYFKGPGYRSSLDLEQVKPIVRRIFDVVGVERLMLGATDAPFAGFAEQMDYQKVLQFTNDLADDVANDFSDKERLLCDNAKELYGF